MKILIYLLAFFIIGLASSKVIQKDGQFVDESGRTRVFHGVNIVYKLPPYFPTEDKFDPFTSLVEEDFINLKKFGFNLVRLGVMWESLEISPGVYNYTLLEKYSSLVQKLGSLGIYTIVDAHQDVFSRLTCGEGVPTFYIDDSLNYDKNCSGSLLKRFLHLMGVCKGMSEYNYKLDSQGFPLISECQKQMFALYHTTSDITSLYDKLYNNINGLLDKFISFWKVLANEFKDNPFVIGYDIWNEPFPGGLYDNPLSRLIPGRPDDDQMLPFYRKIDSELRKVDPNFTLMYEPTPFPDILPILGFRFKGNFKDTPLKGDLSQKQVYNYHSYCCQTSMEICKNGEPPLEKADYCRSYHLEKVNDSQQYASKFNIGSIITEFGACFNTQACFNEISSLADAADNYLVSWAYWQYKPFLDFTTSCPDNQEGVFNSDGSPQEYKYKALTRTYVQAFQGKGISVNYDTTTKEFTAEFELDESIREPSVIYYNKELNYKDGVTLEYNLNDSYELKINDEEENYLKVYINRKTEGILNMHFKEGSHSEKVLLTLRSKNASNADDIIKESQSNHHLNFMNDY